MTPAVAQFLSEGGGQDEVSALRYLKWDDKFKNEKPYVLFIGPQSNSPSSNFTYEAGSEQIIRDIR